MTDVNYTDAMVEKMTEQYTANPTLDTAKTIAADIGKSTKSVVAKLVNLGIYKKAETTNKSADGRVLVKGELVRMIQKHYDIEVNSLVKATKIDLQKLVDAMIPAEVEAETTEV